MVDLHLYVEGGGAGRYQQRLVREGFHLFLEKAGFVGRLPRIVASGARNNAYDEYCTALKQGKKAMLLVDSEGPVTARTAWDHLGQSPKDRWHKPVNADDTDCHLMVQSMESWLLSDLATLKHYFGQKFQDKPLRPVEELSPKSAENYLAAVTKRCVPKGKYDKGRHSFDLLGRIDPAKVIQASPWAARFITTLTARMGA